MVGVGVVGGESVGRSVEGGRGLVVGGVVSRSVGGKERKQRVRFVVG